MASLRAGPDSRPSLPITTGPAGRVSVKLQAYAAATLSVSDSPTIPRSPETLTMSGSECFEFVAVSFFIGFPVEIAACFGRAEYKSKQNLTNTRVSMEFIDGVNVC